MAYLGLLFVGAVLFVNGLSLLGKIDAKGAAPINVFVGSLLVVVTLYGIFPARDLTVADNLVTIISTAGFMLFGFTYLYVGVLNYTGHSGNGLGWYCAWAALVSAGLAAVNFVRFGDAKFGMLWVLWAILFALFFLVLALGMDSLTRATGWVAMIEALITATIPSALLMLGWWDSMPQWVAVAAGLFAILVFILLAFRSLPSAASPSESSETPATYR